MRRLLLVSGTIFLGLVVAFWLWSNERRESLPAAGLVPAESAPIIDPDHAPGAVEYQELVERFGPAPPPDQKYKIGVVMKYFGNQYWQLLAEGMKRQANRFGLILDIRAGASESDAEGQAVRLIELINRKCDAIIISPLTEDNLQKGVQMARRAGIPILNVNEAGREKAHYFVGPRQYKSGVLAGEFFLKQAPAGGGPVAVLMGLRGIYAAEQRTKGFIETIRQGPFTLAAREYCDWDLQSALEKADRILEEHPDLFGFYCNNDNMALGALEAVKKAGRLGRVLVVGTDGIEPAYESIRGGGMSATIDTFPVRTGEIAVETVFRLLEGQDLPQVVYSPQKLIFGLDLDQPFNEL